MPLAYTQIGFIKKPFGLKGELKISVEDKYLEDLVQSEVIFIEMGGKPVPYFLESIREGNAILLKLEEVDSKEAAIKLSSKAINLRSSDILEEHERTLEPTENHLQFQKYVGFSIQSTEKDLIGVIEEIQEFPQQEMALVMYEGREVLIPLHESLIDRVDEQQKVVWVHLPEGLLNL